jgi:hypothetical protein
VKRPALAAFFLLFALTSACATSAGGSQGQPVGRVEGTVFLGPQCAVESVTSPCPDLPMADVALELVADGEVVATDVSDDAGGFALEAAPGSYVLRPVLFPEPLDPTRFAKPVAITLIAGGTVHADVLVDTGIR